MDTAFGFGKVVDGPFESVLEKVTSELAEEGFGVLSDIDVSAKIKEKLERNMPRYRILGACNPALAYQAVSAVPEIGLLLPCNVLVREDNENLVSVSFMDPESVMGLVDHPDIGALASEVKSRLKRVCERL